MKKVEANLLLASAAMANLPDHPSEARLICQAVIQSTPRNSGPRNRANLICTLLDEQARERILAQAEFASLLQSKQTQLKF